jgi:CRP/FNR family transcriptional regulator
MLTYTDKHPMELQQALPELSSRLLAELRQKATVMEIPKKTEILHEGQYVKVIPIVLEGLIKVHTRYEEKELLLYYIRPSESCAMSFSASLGNEPSKIYATTEQDTTALLLPVEELSEWRREFPEMNNLFFKQYNLRYAELLDTIHHVMFNQLDQRLFEHLQHKVKLTGNNPIVISHRELANELGTAREVISRVMKRLEVEKKVKQHQNSIELLQL